MSINQYPEFDPLKKRESAFGEIRNSELTPVAHLDFPYNINSRLIRDESGGGGGIVHASGMAVVSTSASTQASGVLKSRGAIYYTPGQGLHVQSAAIFTSGVPESQQLVGLGDNLCGFFFGYSGVQFGVVHRCVAADDFVPQSEWNLNKYPTLDPSLGNMYCIRLQMGFGHVDFGIEDGVTGDTVNVHRFEFSNAQLNPSTLNPHLPLTVQALNTGNSSDLSVSVHSIAGFKEGREIDRGIVSASGATADIGTTLVPLISYRVKEVFQNRQNQVLVDLLRAYGNNDGNQAVEFVFLFGATLTGASFADFDTDTSVMEIDTSATALTGGLQVISGFVRPNSSDTFDIVNMGLQMARGDVATIAARRTSGSSANATGGMIWREIF